MPTFNDFPLRLVTPAFDSELTDVLMELEHLRRLELRGDTPSPVFHQLKGIFHMLESLRSARIEGNRTTIAEYVEVKIEESERPADQERSESLQEIHNVEKAMAYVEHEVESRVPITNMLVRELHALTVQGLSMEREGDRTPGRYRSGPVHIACAEHLPPDHSTVQAYMDEWLDFINRPDPPRHDLLKTALAHHRFTWIHPFSNGNGRVVRLLTYALLIKYGFNVRQDRILNPTAVFCNDRDAYYAMLARADTGTDEGLLAWCLYVLRGLAEEIRKIDRLTDYAYLSRHVLMPAVEFALGRRMIQPDEAKALRFAVEHKEFKAGDLTRVLRQTDRQRTAFVANLKDRRLIAPITVNGRTYTINFVNSYLLRGVMRALEREDFVPSMGT